MGFIPYDPASVGGLNARGLLRKWLPADIAFFDPDPVGPRMRVVVNDLPAGAMRLKQTADGILATVVNGEVLLEANEHTGAQSGQLLRGPLSR